MKKIVKTLVFGVAFKDDQQHRLTNTLQLGGGDGVTSGTLSNMP